MTMPETQGKEFVEGEVWAAFLIHHMEDQLNIFDDIRKESTV